MPVKRKVVNCDGDEFESISSAARFFKVSTSSISASLKYGVKINGYKWRYSDNSFFDSYKSNKRVVIREDGVEYESITYAAKQNKRCHSSIREAIQNKTKCAGYTWNYKEPRVFNQDFIVGEIWKQHPELPVCVSDHGRIDNIRITYGSYTYDGYKKVRVDKKDYRVHRLVAETFLPNPDNQPNVDHIDCDKTNNKVSNLRWCTQKQNINWYHKKEE